MPFSCFLFPKDIPAEKYESQHRTFSSEAESSPSFLAQPLLLNIADVKEVVKFFIQRSFVDLMAVLKA